MTVATPTIRLLTDSGAAKDLITNSPDLIVSDPAVGVVKRTYLQSNEGQAWPEYYVPDADGVYSVVVTDAGADGSTASASITFTLDTIAPTTPKVSLANDTGDSSTDGVTQHAELTKKAPETGAARSYLLNGVASDSYVMPSVDGSYVLVVTDTDIAGNSASTTLEFTLDKTLRTPTAVLTLDSGVKGDGRSNSAEVTFSLLEGLGDTRTYTVNGGDASDEFLTPTVEGTYTVVVLDKDPAGNTATTTLVFTLDKTLNAPTANLAVDSGDSQEDQITNSAALSLSSQGSGATRTYQVDDLTASLTYVEPTAQGSHTVLVTDTDAAGNTAEVSVSFTLDTELTTPTIAFGSGSTAQDATSRSAALVFNGKDTDATRVYTLSKGHTVVSSGSDYAAPTADGDYTLTVQDTDIAGNTKSASLRFTLDTTAPSVPTLNLVENSGVSGDAWTNNAALTVSDIGQGVTRSYTVRLNGEVVFVGAQYNPPSANGDYVVLVEDTDTAGNASRAQISFTLDTSLTQTTVSLEHDSGANTADLLTNSAELHLSPKEEDATRTYQVDGGAASQSYVEPVLDGSHTVVVTDTDRAGNVKSAHLTYTLDTIIAAPTVALKNGISGESPITASADLTFSVKAADVTRAYTITVGNQSTTSDHYVAPQENGNYTVQVTDTDTAGNIKIASVDFSLEKSTTGKTVDFQAYQWKSHVLLDQVVISDTSQTSTTENGLGQFTAVTESTLLVTAERAIPAAETDITSAAVNLQDAIAILKMVVGLDVNGSGKPLSPYQALAADFNGDGVVSLTDAIGVLKHVVGLAQTSAPHWVFVNEADLTVPAKATANPGTAPAISSELGGGADVHVGLVGYLVGDVDGSFAGLPSPSLLPTTYFSELVTPTSGLSLSQFGVYA